MIILEYYHIALELIVGYILLFIATKVLGKTLLTHITTFDFICSIILSELVGNALYDDELGISFILFSIVIWTILISTTEWVTQKFRRTRNFLEGKPSILIDHGKLSFEEMKKNHLDINQLLHLLRSKDIFTMREVQYAILEANGCLTVLKKHSQDCRNQGKQETQSGPFLAITLISDGELILENLEETKLTKAYLEKELEKQNLRIEEALYVEWLEGDGLFIQGY